MTDIYKDLLHLSRYSNLKNLSSAEKNVIVNMVKVDTLFFGKCILGDEELPMHHHIRKEYAQMHREINAELDSMKKGDKLACVAPRGHAKCLGINEPILTPTRWKKIKDIVEGDLVLGSDGRAKTVTHVSNIMLKTLYKLETRDGRSVLCSGDHLWKVRLLNGLNKQTESHKIYTTEELIERRYNRPRIDKRCNKLQDCFMFAIDTVSPVHFRKKDLPIDPYTLGALIGDGGFTNPTTVFFSHCDDIEEMKSYMVGDFSETKRDKRGSNAHRFTVRKIYKEIKDLGLKCNSHGKFIPEIYKFGNIEQRLALLRGLMDTDGTVQNPRGVGCCVSYCTVSERLADDVVDIVRSLGGRANKYFSENDYSGYYRVGVHIKTNPFKLKRKAKNFVPARQLWSSITNIEKIGVGESKCIAVDSEDKLYVTKDYLLTHNTTFIDLIYPLKRITFGQEFFVLMISESEKQSIFNLETLGDEIEYNPKYKFFFGNRKGEIWGKEQKIVISRPAFGEYEQLTCKLLVRGQGQKVRGIKYGPYRPTLTIGDDFEGEANALTENERFKMRRWINAAVVPGSDSARIVFVGTIIDNEAWLNRIAGSEGWKKGKYIRKGWRHLYFQAVKQDTKPGEFVGEGKEILDKEGIPEVQWKARRPYSWLMNEKERLESEGDVQFFFQEYQNTPYTDAFRVFRQQDIQYWDGFHSIDKNGVLMLHIRRLNGEPVRKDIPVNSFIGSDPASSENIKADYTVHLRNFVDKDHNVYIDKYFRGQVTPIDGANELFELMEELGRDTKGRQPRLTNIEKTGHTMLEGYIRELCKKVGRFYNIMARDAIKNKFFRIKEMQPRYASKAVYIREEHTEHEHELLNFRSHGTVKKDTLDAARWSMEDIYPPDLVEIQGKWTPPTPAVFHDYETGASFGSIEEYEKFTGRRM